MRYSVLQTVLTVALALCVSSCSTSRTATREVSSSKFQVSSIRDSLLVERVEVHDTLREVTTITVDRNDKGDTLRQSIVTDRERVRNAADMRSKTVDVRVVRDTVYIEKRDSVEVKEPSLNPQPSSLLLHLKWTFALICAIIVLIIVIKLGLRGSLL